MRPYVFWGSKGMLDPPKGAGAALGILPPELVHQNKASDKTRPHFTPDSKVFRLEPPLSIFDCVPGSNQDH